MSVTDETRNDIRQMMECSYPMRRLLPELNDTNRQDITTVIHILETYQKQYTDLPKGDLEMLTENIRFVRTLYDVVSMSKKYYEKIRKGDTI